MSYNAYAFVVDLILGIGIVIVVYLLLRYSLRNLLDQVLKLPAGTSFYLRAFLLVFLYLALAHVLTEFSLKPEARFLEYVWAVAAVLEKIFKDASVVLLVYLGLITALVAVLRAKDGK